LILGVLRNLTANPEAGPVLARMRERMKQMRARSGDVDE
jgi:hypothetical protein